MKVKREKIEKKGKRREEGYDRKMESILRKLTKCTGKSEEEVRNEVREELLELEAEVSAMIELLKEKKAPKAKTAPKKKTAVVVEATEATGGSEGSEVII